MDKTGTTLVNMHLHATPKDFPDIPFASRSSEHRERVIDAMVRDVEAAGKEFGIDNIIVENLPTKPTDDGVHPLFCSVEAETVRTVIERTGCGLLLDIDHARISSSILGVDAREYVESLPVDRIGELHAAGIKRIDGVLDDHQGFSQECWGYVDWAMERLKSGAWKTPDIFAFEYGGIGELFAWRSKEEVLAEQVPIFRAKIEKLSK
jgi:uncharacterized protein (UPF0276 family)